MISEKETVTSTFKFITNKKNKEHTANLEHIKYKSNIMIFIVKITYKAKSLQYIRMYITRNIYF